MSEEASDLHCEEEVCVYTINKEERMAFTWKICNLSACYKEAGVDIVTPIFSLPSFPDVKWYLELYPNGTKEGKEGVYVCLRNVSTGAFGTFDLFVTYKDKSDCIVNPWKTISFKGTDSVDHILLFNNRDEMMSKCSVDDGIALPCVIRSCVYKRWLAKSNSKDSQSQLLPNDDKFSSDTECAGLTIEASREKLFAHLSDNLSPLCELSKNLASLFIEDKFTDVALMTQSKKIYAHKCILAARSSVFNALLADMDSGILEVNDVSYECMLEAVRFIYTGFANLSETEGGVKAWDLIAAADKFDLDGLKLVCEKQLIDSLDVSNVVDILIAADRFHVSNLRTKSISLIRDNASKIVDSPKFKQLPGALVLEVLSFIVTNQTK